MVNRIDLTVLRGQLFILPNTGLIRQELTDALDSFSERSQESLAELVERAEALIRQHDQVVLSDNMPT